MNTRLGLLYLAHAANDLALFYTMLRQDTPRLRREGRLHEAYLWNKRAAKLLRVS